MNKHVLTGFTSAMISFGMWTAPVAQAYSGYAQRTYARLLQKKSVDTSGYQHKIIKTDMPRQSASLTSKNFWMQSVNEEEFQSVELGVSDIAVSDSSMGQGLLGSGKTQSTDLDIASPVRVRELLIVDAATPEKNVLFQQIKPGVDVVEISSDEEGLDQLIDVLSRYSNLASLHIVSHAEEGKVLLGNRWISSRTMENHPGIFAALKSAVRDGGDVLFYGCNLARGELGEAFLDIVSRNTNLDIAASDDETGSASKSGDWELEILRGSIETDTPFSPVALADFASVLAITDGSGGTINLGNFPGNVLTYYSTNTYSNVDGSGFNLRISADTSGGQEFGGAQYGQIYVNSYGNVGTTKVYLEFTNGESFDASSIYIYNGQASTKTFNFSSDQGDSQNSNSLNDGGSQTVNLSGFTGITRLTIANNDGSDLLWFRLDNLNIANVSAALDSDGSVTASGAVSEPVALDTTIDSAGEAVEVFDFTVSDGGTSDGLAMNVSQVVLSVTGTSSDAQRSDITWRLNGPDASNVTGVYNAGSDTITFPGLSISVADGGSEVYTVNAYYNNNTGLTEGLTYILSVDGDTDLTVGGSGTQMGATSAVTNGLGSTVDVTATALAFTTQPATSVSGSALGTQPVVTARDAFGNTDSDFTETITLTEASAGSLTNGSVAASSGVATFIGLTYNATADQQSFTLTANDQDGVGSNLPTVNAGAVTSDVVATSLVFDTQPAPLSVNSGIATNFTSVPVVSARDGNNVVDTGYSSSISLAEVNGAGSAIMSATGDTDGSGATVTITPSSGVSTFTGMQITYTASGGSNENFNLQASSGGLSTASSSQITASVDSTPPTINSVSVPANATYIAGQNLDFTVNFDENVTVNTGGGTPQISITVGSTTRQATYQSGSGTSALLFRYTIQSGDVDSDGIAIGSLSANGGTLRDAASNNANLTLNSVGSTTSVLVDAAAPTVASVTVPANATYITGQNLDFTLNFGENVTVNTAGGTPQLSVTVGATTRQATYQSGSGSSALLFRYTIQSGEVDSDGIAIGTLSANGGTLRDVVGNNANLTLNSVGSTTSVLVDAAAPAVTSVTVPANATYITSQNLDFTLNFGENVTVNTAGGTPQLSITVGATTRQATYQSGSGSSALLFRYTIQSGEVDSDGIAIGALSANGGTLRDAVGNNADLTLNSVGSTTSVLVDAAVPTVTSVTVPANATYTASQDLDFTVNFGENVTVNTGGGTPQISLTIGATTRQATYQSGSGTSALVFRYAVQSGDLDSDGIAIGALAANGGTLRDGSGNDANLTLNSVGSTTSVLVAADIPSITSSTYDFSSGVLTVTGVDFVANAGAANDVDASNFTFTGESGATYTLTDTAGAEISSSTSFSLTLSAADRLNVNGLLNKNGLSSDGATTYNLAAADDFIVAYSAGNSADATNAITVSNVVAPTITSATYDATTHTLVVTGTNFVALPGANNDVDLTRISFTGEASGGISRIGGSYNFPSPYSLSTTSNVEVSSSTSFTVTLSGTDRTNVSGIFTANGTAADNGTTYNVRMLDNWMAGAAASSDISDLSGNAITVSNAFVVSIASQTDPSTNGGFDGEVTVGTSGGVGPYLYGWSNGASSASANGLIAGSEYFINVRDSVGVEREISVTLDNPIPTITSATYDASSGVLTVTGTNFEPASGAANDVNVSNLTLTGQGNGTYTLTSGNVEISSATSFSVTLSATDRTAVNTLLDRDGTSSTDTTVYNLAAADDFITDAPNGNSADLTGNSITVANTDSTAPVVAEVTPVATPNNVATPSVVISTDEAGTLAVGGSCGSSSEGAISSGNTSITLTQTDNSTALTSGTYNDCTVTVTDAAGNASTAVTLSSFVVDVTAPSLTINTGLTLDEGDTAVAITDSALVASDNLSAAADITYQVSSVPSEGSLSRDGTALENGDSFTQADVNTGLMTYDHGAGETTSDSFSFTLSDALDNASSALNFSFTISGVNDAPVADADAQSVDEDNAVMVNVLANDSDADGTLNPASVTVATAATNGSTSVNVSTGVITYTPNANFNGSDTFTYTVEDDSMQASAPATVTITVNAVNDLPVAVADNVAIDVNSSIAIDVAANDTDVDTGDAADPTSIVIATAPADGNAVFNSSTNQIDYTPNTDFEGTDTFTYTIEDSQGGTSLAGTVTVTVTNNPPVADDDVASTDEDNAVTVNVLSNDADSDGSLVNASVAVVTAPANGSAEVNTTTGEITYTPALNFNGSDSFTYSVQDDVGGTSLPATVSITVNPINDAPVATDDTANLMEDESFTINVLGNDSDVDGSFDLTSVTVVDAPQSGIASVEASGAIVYTPLDNFAGSDSFTYQVDDDLGLSSNTATVTLTVAAVNDAPIANNDSADVTARSVTVIDILANDQDIDGDLDAAGIVFTVMPTQGVLSNNNDGTVSYTANQDANVLVVDSFSYTVDDNLGATSNAATVTLRIIPDSAPTISGTPTGILEDGQAYSFVPSVSAAPGFTLTYSVSNAPAWASFNTSTGALTGTPSAQDRATFGTIQISVSDGFASASLPAFSIEVISSADSDGDTISDGQEGLDGTDPTDADDYLDLEPPEVTAPADIILDATALYTEVSLAQLLSLNDNASNDDIDNALAQLTSDNVDGDGCCNLSATNLIDGQLRLRPGRTQVRWQAQDNKDNSTVVTQGVYVRPLVSLSKNAVTAEGSTVAMSILLNGNAPSYPFTVPYVIDTSSSANAEDHSLVNGSVTFNEGEKSARVIFDVTADDVSEGSEQLIVRLDDRTSNAEDLQDGFNADRFDINSGVKNSYTLTIAETNLAPDVALSLRQNGTKTVQITADGGNVVVTANARDPNADDTLSFDWSATDNVLSDTDGNSSDASFTFNPAGLSPGRYRMRLSVSDGQASDNARLFFRVVAALPALAVSNDSDNDGLSDADEGAGDDDGDGIPNYLDNIDETNILPEVANQTDAFLMECDPGVRCRLGEFSLLGESGGARMSIEEARGFEGFIDDASYTLSDLFDFEMDELPESGTSVRVVIPQVLPIPANAVYRKFINGQWVTFAEDANNTLHSTAGEPGFCPPPGDDSWVPGLMEGFSCVQLTIEDGGPNDADGEANGSVADPGGIGVQNVSAIKTTGGGGSASWGLLLLGALAWISRRLRGATCALVLCVGLVTFVQAPATYAQDERQVFVELSILSVEGDQSRGDFESTMANAGVTTEATRYDVSQSAFHLMGGFKFNKYLSATFGYADLGEVDVDFSALAVDEDQLEAALDAAYPHTGSGFTLGGRGEYALTDKVNLMVDLGLFFWDGDLERVEGADVDLDMDGTDLWFGLAGEYVLSERVSLGVLWRSYGLDGQSAEGLGVAVRGWF